MASVIRTRIPEARRAAMLAEAQELALQRATQWRLHRRSKEGEQLGSFWIVEASSEEAAIIAVCDSQGFRRSDPQAPTRAFPLLKSSEWREINEQVGLA